MRIDSSVERVARKGKEIPMYNNVKLQCTKEKLVSLMVVLALSAVAQGALIDYDFAGYSVSEASMEATFGTKVAELNAKTYGFDFSGGNPEHGFRNLNIISQVYVATQAVNVGTGVDGTPINLQPGDYTFAYTLDYSQLFYGFMYPNSAVSDLQLARIAALGPTSNPGEMIAFDAIVAGGYNTNSDFGGGSGTPPLQAPPAGFSGELLDFGPTFLTGKVEYDWGSSVVMPGDKAMVMIFVSGDVDVWQVGWGSENGHGKSTLSERQAIGDTGEGGSVIGGGQTVPGNIPVLVPVVPEPVSMSALVFGSIVILTKRRR